MEETSEFFRQRILSSAPRQEPGDFPVDFRETPAETKDETRLIPMRITRFGFGDVQGNYLRVPDVLWIGYHRAFLRFPGNLTEFFRFLRKYFLVSEFPQPSKRDSTKVRGRNMTENPSQK